MVSFPIRLSFVWLAGYTSPLFNFYGCLAPWLTFPLAGANPLVATVRRTDSSLSPACPVLINLPPSHHFFSFFLCLIRTVPTSASSVSDSAGASSFGPLSSGSSQHPFGLFGPKTFSPPASSLSVQLYDEFVSRGNVAVLKCLILTVANSVAGPVNLANSASGKGHSASAALLYPSNAYHYHRTSGTPSHHFASTPTADWPADSLASEFLFEWRIKNGPAASAITGETILTLRSNQTQGKSSASPKTVIC